MDVKLPTAYWPDRVSLEQKVAPHTKLTIAELEGAGCIRHFWISPGLGNESGRNIMLRIFFDGHPLPYVQAPLGDFFGVMHGKHWYPVNTPYIAVLEKVGYNCYFPMPFAAGARIEIETGADSAFICTMVDWHRYDAKDFTEPRRFRAQWRRENPTRSYDREYFMLDTPGPGELKGFFLGVRLKDNTDRWSHGGAENIYIDGEGETPVYLRGVGGEDSFGTAFGGALHTPETALFCGMPYYVHEDTGEARPAQRVTGYRFFIHDAIPFRRSLHMRFGCMENDICSTVYWYTPVAPAAEVPLTFADTKTGSPCNVAPFKSPSGTGTWSVCGPFPAAEYDAEDFLSRESFTKQKTYPVGTGNTYGTEAVKDAVWREAAAFGHFVDFRHFYRLRKRGVSPTEDGFAVAVSAVTKKKAGQVTIEVSYDDQLYLRWNGELHCLPAHGAFRKQTLTLSGKAGRNELVIALTNTRGINHGGWCFALSVKDADGLLLPESVGGGLK